MNQIKVLVSETAGFIGKPEKSRLLDFINVIGGIVGEKAFRNCMSTQTGDVPATRAIAVLLKKLTGYQPKTHCRHGIARCVERHREHYNV